MYSTAQPLDPQEWQVLPPSGQSKPPTKAQIATRRICALVSVEAAVSGDVKAATKAVARRIGLGFWTVANIKRGRAKTCDATIFEQIKEAYLDLCQRQLAALQHEISLIQEANPDAHVDDLFDEASRLAARLADARSGSLADRAHGRLRKHLAARKRGSLASLTTPDDPSAS